MFSLSFERMVPELIKISHLQIEILNYMNAGEWIQKMTAYLKEKDFWTSIKDVVDEWKACESSKTSEPAAAASSAEATVPGTTIFTKPEDSKTERSALKHDDLIEKWKNKSKKKNWQKINYQAISTLLFIISTSDQQAVENLKYISDIWNYIINKYIQINYLILITVFSSYFRWEKNETHSIEEAAQEIKYFTNQIPQLNSPNLDA